MTKVRWRFRKILWPSQNIWTLTPPFTIENPSFSMSLLSTQEHTKVDLKGLRAHHPLMCQNFANFISIRTILVLDWRKWPFFGIFWLFMYHLCSKKLRVHWAAFEGKIVRYLKVSLWCSTWSCPFVWKLDVVTKMIPNSAGRTYNLF